MDPESCLKATLRALALSAPIQLKLYPASDYEVVCENCRFSMLYGEWVEHLDGRRYLDGLDPSRRVAVARVDEASKRANGAPCHERRYLTKGEDFQSLRLAAREALGAFGWTRGAPDPNFLWGRDEFAAARGAELRRERAARIEARPAGGTEEDFADIPGLDPRPLSATRFRKLLGEVRWFSRLGKPHPRDGLVERIKKWEDWGGPESRGGDAIGPEQADWQDDLLPAKPIERAPIERLWEEVTAECREAIARVFRGKIDVDPWHGPTFAAGQACWVAATIACSLRLGRPIPKNALRQWAWFARGHWPCMYSRDDLRPDREGRFSQEVLERAWLVVY